MKKILFVGAEVMPFAATGGLGDVMGSLPAAIKAAAKDDVDVRVVMPLYGSIAETWRKKMKTEVEYTLSLSWRNQYCGIKSLSKDGVTYYFVDNEYYFKRDTLYGCYDDGERFAFFCKAAVDMLGRIGFYPDVLHAHDWQAALAPIYLNEKYRDAYGYENIRTVFTIHNIEYQGKYDFFILGDVFELDGKSRHIVEYDGCINLMKGAIACADRVSTVSPRYAEEICTPEYAHGLHPILTESKGKLCGILNGIDYRYYNPGTDMGIAKKFNWRSMQSKYENKSALRAELGLPDDKDVPLVAVISRLAGHKGLDLISEMMYNILATEDMQLVVLGRGEKIYEEFFCRLEKAFPDRVRALIAYDRDLAKRIYAATDIFLMPSKSEPCGLSQMIASRYGAIPVTRETGGLYDSIKGYWEHDGIVEGNGFTFANYDAGELADRTRVALAVWRDEAKRYPLMTKIMRTDFSWKNSALSYLKLYETL